MLQMHSTMGREETYASATVDGVARHCIYNRIGRGSLCKRSKYGGSSDIVSAQHFLVALQQLDLNDCMRHTCDNPYLLIL